MLRFSSDRTRVIAGLDLTVQLSGSSKTTSDNELLFNEIVLSRVWFHKLENVLPPH